MEKVLRFTGEYCDPVTGGYPLGHGYRWYVPALMRFNAPDSLSPFREGGVHPYCYCGADPLNYRDPSGHFGEVSDFEWESTVEASLRLDRELYGPGGHLAPPTEGAAASRASVSIAAQRAASPSPAPASPPRLRTPSTLGSAAGSPAYSLPGSAPASPLLPAAPSVEQLPSTSAAGQARAVSPAAMIPAASLNTWNEIRDEALMRLPNGQLTRETRHVFVGHLVDVLHERKITVRDLLDYDAESASRDAGYDGVHTTIVSNARKNLQRRDASEPTKAAARRTLAVFALDPDVTHLP